MQHYLFSFQAETQFLEDGQPVARVLDIGVAKTYSLQRILQHLSKKEVAFPDNTKGIIIKEISEEEYVNLKESK